MIGLFCLVIGLFCVVIGLFGFDLKHMWRTLQAGFTWPTKTVPVAVCPVISPRLSLVPPRMTRKVCDAYMCLCVCVCVFVCVCLCVCVCVVLWVCGCVGVWVCGCVGVWVLRVVCCVLCVCVSVHHLCVRTIMG